MPDFWTHIHGGHQLIEPLPPLRYKNLFNYACQGPDFLFYLNFSPLKGKRIGKELGDTLHNNLAQEFLEHLYETARQSKDLQIQDYFYGALCHYILDAYMHPLINAYATDVYTHKDVEMAMDLIINAHLNKAAPKDDNPRNYLDFQMDFKALNAWYFESVKLIHNEAISDQWIKMAQKDFMDFHILFSDINPLKATILKWIHKFIPVNAYIYPTELQTDLYTKERIQEVEDTFDKAIVAGRRILLKAEDGFLNPQKAITLFEGFNKLNYSGLPY